MNTILIRLLYFQMGSHDITSPLTINPQISQEDNEWLYPQQMIKGIKRGVANSIILAFSPTNLLNLVDYG